jgi:hypothetical protein
MPIPTSLKIIALLPPLRVQGVSFSGKIKSFPTKVSPALDKRRAKLRSRLRFGPNDLKPHNPSGLEVVNRVLVNARAIGEFLATPP